MRINKGSVFGYDTAALNAVFSKPSGNTVRQYDSLLTGALDAFIHADYYPFKGIESRIGAALRSRSGKRKLSVLAELPDMLSRSDFQSVRDLGRLIGDRLREEGIVPVRVKAMGKRSIDSAYDAWWFLYYHPRLCLRSRTPEPEESARELRAKGFIVKRDKCGKYWRLWRHHLRHAVESNLSIFYAKVDSGGHQNDDSALNLYPEVWLEAGPIEWGYATPWDNETSLIEYHDTDLDCGAPTFDEALVQMARLALKKYGDYKGGGESICNYGAEGKCGTPRCADCEDLKLSAKSLRKRIREAKGA